MNFRYLIYIVSILILISCNGIKQLAFVGEYHEIGWSPMSQEYKFNKDNTFEHYYSDDTYGTFGKGTYKIHGNRLILDYDYLPVDSLIFIEKVNKPSDSIKLDMIIMNAGFASDIRIYEKDSLIYKSHIKSDSISVSLKKPLTKIKIMVGTFFDGVIDETKFEREINVESYSYCKFEYFPSDSWYEFNTDKDKIIKLKNIRDGYFEIHKGKYEWRYQRK